MHALVGVIRYEYRMAVRRWGLWIGSLLAGALYFLSFDPSASKAPWTSGR